MYNITCETIHKKIHMDSLNQKSSLNKTYFILKIQLHVNES
jgi:hypothetical protein